jgi:hypothetical protein
VAVVAILPDLTQGPGSRGADLRVWLAEFEREHIAYSRLRSIATGLRNLGRQLEAEREPPDLAAAATSLVEAADAVLVAF